jgi:hypothetical protein
VGLVTNFGQLLALRLLLGLFECGLFPGISLYLTGWYRVSGPGIRPGFNLRGIELKLRSVLDREKKSPSGSRSSSQEPCWQGEFSQSENRQAREMLILSIRVLVLSEVSSAVSPQAGYMRAIDVRGADNIALAQTVSLRCKVSVAKTDGHGL